MSSDQKKVISDVALTTINSECRISPRFRRRPYDTGFETSKNHQAKINWWNAPVQTIYLRENTFNVGNITKHFHGSAPAHTGLPHTSNEFDVKNFDNTKINPTSRTSLIENIPVPISLPNYLRDDIAENIDHFSQGTKLLMSSDAKSCVGLLNPNEEDQMLVTGYRRSRSRTIICWFGILLSCGLLRLILHWWRHLYLKATHTICTLEEAEAVLIEENFQGKHKIFHVKNIIILNEQYLREKFISEVENVQIVEFIDKIRGKDFYLETHFGNGQFKATNSLRMFILKQLRYAWDQEKQTFVQLKGLDGLVPTEYFYSQRGLSKNEQLARRLAYGQNEITVPYKNVKTLLLLEILNPFYIFQIFSVVLWFIYSYYYYACVIVLMSVFGISMSIRQTKKNQDDLRKTVENTGFALVIDDEGNVVKKATKELVIGDIIEIPSTGCTLQCDAILLSGNCILDESMLTGESVPVTKTPLPLRRDVTYSKKEHARHTIFCGTKVIQTRSIDGKQVHAIVINTGNITAKGGLIRSILYPPPVDYKFERDSYKFIECLAVIALIGFVYTLVTKILRGNDAVDIAVESLDLITIVVPPALPAAMTVGRFYAQKRLENNSIYCIAPRSINVAGSIDCCCFDKTGTLTEDGLDMWGIVPTSATNQFQIPMKDISRLPYDHFLFGLVTCHSITMMNGKLMGDPLDLKMFECTGWSLEDSKEIPDMQKFNLIHPVIVRPPRKEHSELCNSSESSVLGAQQMTQRHSSVDDLLADAGLLNDECKNDHGIVREFPFSSNLQRMSVISRRLGEKHFNVYCKGSPEMIQQLCKANTIPDNFSQQLSIFAKQGYRVIALSYKPLGNKINYTKVQRLSRENVESNLEFLGFVIMENRLKPDTAEVINSLTSANIKTVMVTGDNILTAVSVAHDCGIISKTDVVVTVNVRQIENEQRSNANNSYEVYYSVEFGNHNEEFDPLSFNKNSNPLNKEQSIEHDDESSVSTEIFSLPYSNSVASINTYESWLHKDIEVGNQNNFEKPEHSAVTCKNNYRFAMVGRTWEIVRHNFPDLTRFFLTRGSVFARMSPDQKQALIVELQSLDYCVAMCGDGANDCGALKVAHTGISLSETESSIASPFTSRNGTIACVPNVIKEGRAALVTSFGIFKYMAAYSMVQFVSVMILYSIDSNLTDKQYLYIDLGLISVFAFYFGKTEAYDGPLFKHAPLSSLISVTPLSSIAVHLIIVILFQVAGWFQLYRQPWFTPFKFSEEKKDHLGCHENYTLFAISSFQYIVLAFVFSKSKPYRKPLWSNLSFCLSLLINTCVVLYLVLGPTDFITNFFQIVLPPQSFRYWMLFYGCSSFIVHVLVESLLIEELILKRLQVPRANKVPTSKQKYVHIEYELECLKNWPEITHEYEKSINGLEMQVVEPKYASFKAEQKYDIPKDTAFSGFFDNIHCTVPEKISA